MIDALLIGLMLWAAVLTAVFTDLFRATVSFMVFGFLMALIWARLGSIDLAIAEAAVGSGVTGGLFLASLRRLHHYREN